MRIKEGKEMRSEGEKGRESEGRGRRSDEEEEKEGGWRKVEVEETRNK